MKMIGYVIQRLLLLLVSALFLTSANTYADTYDIGVYYFPGWKNNAMGGPFPYPWEKMKPYPERKPLLGWYKEGSISVMDKQLDWMADYGIDYVVFDWLWGRDNKGYLEHSINAYKYTKNKSRVKFSILWANHTQYIFSKSQLTALIKYWCSNFFSNPEYKQLDGKPVVFIFSARILNNNLLKIGMTQAEFLAYADGIAKSRGLPGISIVAGTGAADPQIDYSSRGGFAGFSAYNYHSPSTFRFDSRPGNMSHSYSELDLAYKDHWRWLVKNSTGTFIIPLTSGWDKRPWGGSSDPLHDNSLSTPEEFEMHLLDAKQLMLSAPERTKNMAVICCWNEYGEGSFIEPTEGYGFSYLEKIRTVFSSE